jgi:hypothetical protein
MIAALAVMTAGLMPAPTAVEHGRGLGTASLQNIHTYAEQSWIGNPFDLMWTWLQSFVFTIL